MKKGLSQTLYLIVVAVVLLVLALVLLSIFGGGIAPIVNLSDAKSICATEASASCAATHSLPPTWTAKTKFTKLNSADANADWYSCLDLGVTAPVPC